MIFGYLNTLKREIELASKHFGKGGENREITSIFIGGGTPSLIDASMIFSLLNSVKGDFNIAKNAEITIEANPESLTAEKLKIYKNAGINRLSIGIQSLDDRNLRAIGRIHDAKTALAAIKTAREYFDNVSCDMIVGLPFDTVESVQEEVETVAKLASHVSVYQLIVEDGTPLKSLVEKGEICLSDDDKTIDLFESANAILKENGYFRYEVSNFARVDKYSRHNLGYWQRNEYLGFGAGAASYLKTDNENKALESETRFTSASGIEKYIDSVLLAEDYFDIKREEVEKLDISDIFDEKIMLGLRTMFGVDKSLIPASILEKYAKFFVFDKNNVAFNDAGFAIMNSILVEIMHFSEDK